MFTAVLIGTVKTIVEYYLPVNRNEILPFALKLVEPDDIINEINQAQKDKCSHLWS